MRICVIGGSGFLGSHVADQLSDEGHEVRIYDHKASPWLRKNQKMFVGDLLNCEKLTKAIKGCDAVYNFAAIADLNDALNRPIETVQINILGNVQALEICRKEGVHRFLYASTVYVHSREGGFYRCSKLAAEEYVEEYHKLYGLDYTILRYGSLYGPRSDGSNGLFSVIKKALETGKLCYEGSPHAMREYIHVEDAARISVSALEESFLNQSVVLTGQESMKVKDLLEMIAEILGLEDSVEFIDGHHPGHYVRTPYADRSRVGRKYIPSMHVDLGQGLLQLVGYIRSQNLKI